MTRALLLLPLIALSACSPQSTSEKIVARAAETVIKPVVVESMTGTEAEGVTRCIVQNAPPSELEALARDIGVIAGSSTIARVLKAANQAETATCIANAGLPQPKG